MPDLSFKMSDFFSEMSKIFSEMSDFFSKMSGIFSEMSDFFLNHSIFAPFQCACFEAVEWCVFVL